MRKCVSWNVFVGEKETSDGRWICIDGIERDTGGVSGSWGPSATASILFFLPALRFFIFAYVDSGFILHTQKLFLCISL